MVADEVGRLTGQTWTDADGATRPLAADDFMVVAPYNDQVALLRRELDADETTAGVRVGTVDKFQGQEAPVVFFTMTASTASDVPRGIDFLFSKNRLNVAISRARSRLHRLHRRTAQQPSQDRRRDGADRRPVRVRRTLRCSRSRAVPRSSSTTASCLGLYRAIWLLVLLYTENEAL